MVRLATILALTASMAFAHGGAFRPPPRPPAGDAFKPKPRPVPGTAARSVGTPMQAWEYWWHLNREPYLRVRDRVERRTVTSGTRLEKDEPFSRREMRDKILLPVMLEAIRSRDEEVRTSAAIGLGKFRAVSASPVLLEVFRRDSVKQVREAAMLGLMILRDPALKDEFRKIATDDKQDRRIRVFAVLGLGFLKDAAFLQQVLQGKGVKLHGANSTIDEMRACAALALGFTGSPAAVAPLVSVAIDKNAPQAARGYAGSALARLKNPFAEPEMVDLVAKKDSNALARYGAAIGTGGIVPQQRRAVIDLLGKAATRDRDRRLRALLLMSLGRIGGDHAAHFIVGANRTFIANKGFIYLALGISGSADAGDVLTAMFKDLRNPNDRAACAIGLALAGHRKAIPMLRKQLERNNPGFVPHGMVALGILDDRKSIPLVQNILKKNSDPVTRREGAIALALLRRAAAVPDLVGLLRRSKSLYTRGSIATALGMVGDLRAVDPLLDIYRDKRLRGEERAIALAALGRMGDLDEIPLLAQLAFDLNPYVVSDAIAEALTIL